MRLHRLFKRDHPADINIVEKTLVCREQRQRHFGDRHRLVLRLFHHLHHALAALQLFARGFVQVGGELRERRQLAVLRQRQANAAAEFFDDRRLRRAADARHREACVDRRAHAGVEQAGLQKNLPVGDGDDIGRHERRHVAGLRFNDRQRGQRAGLAGHFAAGEFGDGLFVDARGALQQARVQIENIAGIGLAPRRAAQQQRNLAVGPGLLGQVVVDDQRVLAAVAEVFAHGAAGIRRDELLRGRTGGRCGDHDGVLHRAVLLQFARDRGDAGGFLPDRDIDAFDAGAALVDDGVHGDRGLAGLAVADDQFALSAADRHHGVNGFQPDLHRLVHRLARDDAGRDFFNRRDAVVFDFALAVQRPAERVHHAPEQALAGRHFQNAAGAFDRVALGQVLVFAEHHRADRILFKVQRQAESVVGEFQHLALHGVGQAVNARDAVGQHDDAAFGARLAVGFKVCDARFDQFADFGRTQLNGHDGFRVKWVSPKSRG